VVANAVAALSEISDVSTSAAEALELNSQTVNKLCTALNECTEYVTIYTAVDYYQIQQVIFSMNLNFNQIFVDGVRSLFLIA
jgi:rRNA maturation endonuclease Nob1